MDRAVVIVDGGTGNLRSVAKAVVHVGGDPVVSGDPDVIRRAERLVVPGQGAFADFMAELRRRDLDAALLDFLRRGRPYLGICLGLQILFDQSEEHETVAGLGLLRGKVVRFRWDDAPGRERLKIPHMGWNQVIAKPRAGGERMLAKIPDDAYFYFVHSYHGIAGEDADVVLTCDYGGEFVAAVRRENLFACQFHPEKSQVVGLQLLANFVETT
jgi:glutamine amidotransferase